MKGFAPKLTPLLFSLALTGFSVAQPPLRQVTILHTNDSHGRYQSFHVEPGDATSQTGDPGREPSTFTRSGRVGGFARLATVAGEIRRREGAERVLLLHGGDTFSDDLLANLTRGRAVIELMNQVGYQFMALGNHDFDYGLEQTRELQKLAHFPMRGANVLDRDGQPFLGDPWKLFRLGDVKVAVLALGYHNTALTGSRKNTEGLQFTDGIEAVRLRMAEMRRQADLVVVLSHQGSKVDEVLADQVPGIDIIVGAHSHDSILPAKKHGSTWITQALSDGAVVGELKVTMNSQGRIQDLQSCGHTLWEDEVRADPVVEEQIRALREPHKQQLEEVLTRATERIGRQYRSESPFDRLVGDILCEETGSQVAFLPGVGYGVSLSPGPVTREALYALLPHPTKVVTLELTGEQILKILEQSATNQNPATPQERVGGLVQTAGLAWHVDLNLPSGQRVSQVQVGSSSLEPDRFYQVVTNEAMQGGLHRYSTFAAGRKVRVWEEAVTDVVERRLRKMPSISTPGMGEVVLTKAI